MSSGSRSLPRNPPVATSCGTGYPGRTYSKNWGGGDDLPLKKRLNDYGFTKVTGFDPVIQWRHKNVPNDPWKSGTLNSCFGGFSCASGLSVDPNMELRAIDKLASQTAGHNWNAAVTVAEGRKSLSTIRSTIENLGVAMLRLKRGNFRGAVDALYLDPMTTGKLSHSNGIAKNWLNLQYGWLPMLGDAKNAAEFLASTQNRIQSLPRARAEDRKGSYSYHRVDLKATATDFSVAEGLGLSDPFSVAWELVPYSFVVDWFLPIQTYLRAVHFTRRAKFSHICKSTATQHDYQKCEVPYVYYDVQGDSGSFSRKLVVSRQFLSSIDVPPPSIFLKDGGRVKRVLSALALMRVRFR